MYLSRYIKKTNVINIRTPHLRSLEVSILINVYDVCTVYSSAGGQFKCVDNSKFCFLRYYSIAFNARFASIMCIVKPLLKMVHQVKCY